MHLQQQGLLVSTSNWRDRISPSPKHYAVSYSVVRIKDSLAAPIQ